MSLNQEFLDNLDREIRRLKERIQSPTGRVSAGTDSVEEPQTLENKVRLAQLEEMRKNIVMQSHGG